jgi:uncharacterized protein (TIGR03086 family)
MLVPMTGSGEPTALDLMPSALEDFGARVHAVGDSAWARQSPCEDWSALDVVNHLTAEHLWGADLLAGKTIEEVGDRYDGDVVGDQPVEAWDRAASRSLEAWRHAAPDQTVALSYGVTPVSRYAEEMVLDLTVHGWDLARAAGLDDHLPRPLVDHVLAYVREHQEELSGAGVFAAPVEVDSGDPQDRLLGLLGRQP